MNSNEDIIWSACQKLRDDWSGKKRLGEGAFGTVNLVKNRTTGKLAAAKILRPRYWELDNGKIPEIRIFQEFIKNRSSRIIGFLGGVEHPSPTLGFSALLFEFCNAGDLHECMKTYFKRGLKVPTPFIVHSLIHLTEAIGFLHRGLGQPDYIRNDWKPIVHSDIKAANIFLRWNGTANRAKYYPDLVLGDLGLAQCMEDATYSMLPRGTLCHMSPERLPTPLGDVWAVGAVMHSMLFKGEPPVAKRPLSFRGSSEDWLQRPEAHVGKDLKMSISSNKVRRWIKKLLEVEPAKRYGAQDLWEKIPKMRQYRDENFMPLESWAAPMCLY